ncbi:MAG: glutathione S-transferase [marine bacterium B5-7]|nr:MAG: glutathione S-transferase [marine bacterium B5-7]
MKVYGDRLSGNCYKISLLMSLLDINHQWIDVDVRSGETATQDFLKLNPFGKIPVIELDDGCTLAESNAILHYLAAGSRYINDEPFFHGNILKWQFFEQYSHEPYIAVARFINRYLGLPAERRAEYESKQAGGHAALRIMQSQLETSPYLVGEQYTIADISLFAYTHVANEGGFDLTRYPAIEAWIERIESEPGHVGMGA